jgi:DNA-binding NarL/FixJ family response regulator
VAEIAKSSGQHIYWNAPPDESDQDNQLALVLSCAKRGFRGVIFAPDRSPATRNAVLQLMADRIPVVIVDDDLGPPPGPYVSYVSTDEDIGTDLAASRVAELLHGHGSIAIMGVNPRLESGVSRETSFERALALRAPDIRIVIGRFGDELVTPQQQLAQQILERADPVNAIVALTGTATRGAFYAELVENPHLKIPIVGFDQDLLTPTVDIILIDLRMPGLSGIETLEKIMVIAPNARSIVLSSFEYDEEIYAAVKAGAQGYLPKEGPADAIIDAIHLVHRGKQAFPRRIADSLSNRDLLAGLSIREKDVLALVAKGLTNKEVAGTLGLSQFTVRNHLMHIMEKLDATDRTEAIFIAIQTGLITLP